MHDGQTGSRVGVTVTQQMRAWMRVQCLQNVHFDKKCWQFLLLVVFHLKIHGGPSKSQDHKWIPTG
jgi:hypothetical protein